MQGLSEGFPFHQFIFHFYLTALPCMAFIFNKYTKYYKIQGVLLPNTGKYGAVSRLIWGGTKKSMKIVKMLNMWNLVKTIDPGKVSFFFGFSFHNIMFLSYIKFERNLLLRKKIMKL